METLYTNWLFMPCLKFLINVFVIGCAIIAGVIVCVGVYEVIATILSMIFGTDDEGGDE